MKRALISDISRQDGFCRAELLLLEYGYEVHGIKRCTSLFNTQRIAHDLDIARRHSLLKSHRHHISVSKK